ncbi:MAG: CDP-alcohol phosphatidyltransferase family protein [Lachnospiraceae bacterium]|nr:CDP-alcohol phosphatidyltransferase family protein [Lachnospiraceae bacterium]
MANIVTGCRILCSILLLFVPAFSSTFYILYLVAGFTDMIDGTIARKTNTANEFGSRLDTIADIVFVVVCMIKVLPVLTIPTWLYIWIGVIAIIKVFNIISGYIIQKKFVAKHTIMNKITGAVLFILPLTLSIVDLKYSGGFICTIALLAAVQEGHLIRTELAAQRKEEKTDGNNR